MAPQPSTEAWLLELNMKLGFIVGRGGLMAKGTHGTLILGEILSGGLLGNGSCIRETSTGGTDNSSTASLR